MSRTYLFFVDRTTLFISLDFILLKW